jgi:hypothetical protein
VDTGALILGQGFTGSGASLTVNGGTLSSSLKNNFEGDVQLLGGVIDLGATDALGEGDLTVKASDSPVAIDPLGKKITLDNSLVNLQGGTLHVLAGDLTLTGQVTVSKPSEIDTAADVHVTLAGDVADGGSGSTLTVGTLSPDKKNPSGVMLGGMLSAKLDITGGVVLGKSFSGTGSITVDGGFLKSPDTHVTGSIFTGAITEKAGIHQ